MSLGEPHIDVTAMYELYMVMVHPSVTHACGTSYTIYWAWFPNIFLALQTALCNVCVATTLLRRAETMCCVRSRLGVGGAGQAGGEGHVVTMVEVGESSESSGRAVVVLWCFDGRSVDRKRTGYGGYIITCSVLSEYRWWMK